MSETVDVRPEGLEQLRRSVPVPELSELARGYPGVVAVVGGAIRDALLGRSHDDLDVVVDGDLAGFLDRIEALRGRRPAAIGDRFQETHRCLWGGVQVDVSRSQGELREDLARRDFTINAMALPLPPEAAGLDALVDPHGGLEDLRDGRLRCGDPEVLDRDPLRLLRAVRYAATLPGFAIEARTATELRRRAGGLRQVAAERVQAEWRLLLAAPDWVAGLERAGELGLTASTLGDLADLAACRAWAASGRERRGEETGARLAAVILDLVAAGGTASPEAAAGRLREMRWPRRLVSTASTAAAWASELPEVDADRLAERALAAPRVADLAARLGRATRGAAAGTAADRLERFAGRALEKRWVAGADLLRWGVPEGPTVGELLAEAARGQVRRRWSGRDEAREWARRRAREIVEGAA